MKPEFTYVGELPKGNWQFCLVAIEGNADTVVVMDMTGKEAPRMIIDGHLVQVHPA